MSGTGPPTTRCSSGQWNPTQQLSTTEPSSADQWASTGLRPSGIMRSGTCDTALPTSGLQPLYKTGPCKQPDHGLAAPTRPPAIVSAPQQKGPSGPYTALVASGEGNGNHSSIFTCKIPWTEEPGWLQSMGLQRVGQTEQLHFHFLVARGSALLEHTGYPLKKMTSHKRWLLQGCKM